MGFSSLLPLTLRVLLALIPPCFWRDAFFLYFVTLQALAKAPSRGLSPTEHLSPGSEPTEARTRLSLANTPSSRKVLRAVVDVPCDPGKVVTVLASRPGRFPLQPQISQVSLTDYYWGLAFGFRLDLNVFVPHLFHMIMR